MENSNNNDSVSKNLVPLSIIVAGAIVAGAIIFVSGPSSTAPTQGSQKSGSVAQETKNELPSDFRLPNENDFVRGNIDAPITIIEFSDLECPFCAQFHPTMKRIIEENDDVRWIYRHFPLTTIHSRAYMAAVAAECVGNLAGNDAFWDFTDYAFENQKALGEDLYENFAQSAGISLNDFRSCVESSEISDGVDTDFNEARRAGGRGTPFSVIVTEGGELTPISGAVRYESLNAILDQLRNN